MALPLFRKKAQSGTEVLDISRVMKTPSRSTPVENENEESQDRPARASARRFGTAALAVPAEEEGRETDAEAPETEPKTASKAEAFAALEAAARVAEEISREEDSLGTSLDHEALDEAALERPRADKNEVPWRRRDVAIPSEEDLTARRRKPAPETPPEADSELSEDDDALPTEPLAGEAAEPADDDHDGPGELASDEPAEVESVAEKVNEDSAEEAEAMSAPETAAEVPAAEDEPVLTADRSGRRLLADVREAVNAEPADPLPAPKAKGPGFLERITPFALWFSATLILSSFIYAFIVRGVSLPVAGLFAGGVFTFATILLVASVTGAYSPLLLTGVLLRRPKAPMEVAQGLAGRDVLSALGLAETLLDADVDARLVTGRDGVVVYGNEQYMRLAREAGVVSSTGLPPRIDRLFAQATGESSKMFRLARAARSGLEADEIITQSMGKWQNGSPKRRRFEVSVRPMADHGRHIAWRLREVPIQDAKDSYRAAYEHYPRPVLALERSGNIVWLNKAAKDLLGVGAIRDISISDLFLGEPRDLIDAVWEDDPEEMEGRIRAKSQPGGNVSVIFTPFTRAGVGEGFVCVEMMPKAAMAGPVEGAAAALDVSEAPFGVAMVEGDVGTDAKLTSVNKLFAEALGAKEGMKLSEALPAEALRDLVAAIKAKGQAKALTRAVDVVAGSGADGRHLRLMARPIKRRRGAYGPRQMVLYALDVSFQKRMEEDYAHDKRLKAIGKIAGSVAHDFNNFLQAMMGATEFLMRRHPAGDPSYPDLVAIRENAQRARNLTSNLLAFSRKQTLQPEVLSVTELLSDFTPFVQRYVTEKVKVVVDHGRHVGHLKADRSQLELAIMNLAVNARDAMDKGGTLTIASRRVPAEDVAAYGYEVLEEIDQVLIEISDTGSGVPEDIADKIFEPFFTTKGEGKGTGLGLSTVHGIVGQLGGRIFLHNRPGEGATFRIFLPALSEEEAAAAKPAKSNGSRSAEPAGTVDDLTGKGRILIVEDEDSVRNVVVRALEMCGYEIIEAADGDEALDIIHEEEEGFDVILSDIMMPEMDGPTLIEEAGDKIGKAKVIFMSGYAETAMRDKLEQIDGAGYLQKPFTLKKVAAVVKDAMAE